MKLATFDGFFHATQASTPLTGPQTIGSWAAAADGDPSGLWLLSLMADLVIPTSHVWGDVPATAQIDDAAGAAYYAGHTGRGTIIGNPFTDSLWGNGGLVTAWPHAAEVDQYSKLRPTDVDTLVISGDLDFATPAEFATKELLPSLRHGHQVVLHNLGHTGDTWTYETAASSRLINTFLDTGRVDDSAYPQRRMSFDVTPGQPWLAKIVVASLAGLAAFSLLALALLPLRLRRRTSVGTKTGVAHPRRGRPAGRSRRMVPRAAGRAGAVAVDACRLAAAGRALDRRTGGPAHLPGLGAPRLVPLGADGGAVRGGERCRGRGVDRPARGGRPDVRGHRRPGRRPARQPGGPGPRHGRRYAVGPAAAPRARSPPQAPVMTTA